MKIDFSGITLFLRYLEGHCSPQEVLQHPAYQAVCRHADHFSDGIKIDDLEKAKAGHRSPFYGLTNLQANMTAIHQLLRIIETCQEQWLEMAQIAVSRVFPQETVLDITIYPILGYDMGIGHNGTVSMNLNVPLYLHHPEEFLYFLIHECVHILYERHHPIPRINELRTAVQWRSMFTLMVQNEGYAVYVPWKLRQERGELTHDDYQVLQNPEELAQHIQAFKETHLHFQLGRSATQSEYLSLVFGPKRLAYRVGAELIHRIEMTMGIDTVMTAFYLSGDEFVTTYQNLLRK